MSYLSYIFLFLPLAALAFAISKRGEPLKFRAAAGKLLTIAIVVLACFVALNLFQHGTIFLDWNLGQLMSIIVGMAIVIAICSVLVIRDKTSVDT